MIDFTIFIFLRRHGRQTEQSINHAHLLQYRTIKRRRTISRKGHVKSDTIIPENDSSRSSLFAYYSTVGDEHFQENVIYILLGVKDRLSYV